MFDFQKLDVVFLRQKCYLLKGKGEEEAGL
jgi:hypothetical protein